MNIVFFGSANFAVPSLEALFNTRNKISCVVTQPDRVRGRGLKLSATAVKIKTQELGLKIYQPTSINTSETLKFINGLSADLFIVIAYGHILSEEVLNIPKILPVNIHASLLPKYRGAAPINWAIIKGEKKTGISIIKMTKELDVGPIIMQKEIDINETDTAVSLEDKLSHLAAELLLEAIKVIEDNSYRLTPQDEGNVTFAPKLKREDGLINWNESSYSIYNLIRGCFGWPGAFTYYNGKLLKLHKAKVCSFVNLAISSSPGAILKVSKEGIVVSTGKDCLSIEELQLEGKKRMKVNEFIAGHKIYVGETFKEKK